MSESYIFGQKKKICYRTISAQILTDLSEICNVGGLVPALFGLQFEVQSGHRFGRRAHTNIQLNSHKIEQSIEEVLTAIVAVVGSSQTRSTPAQV